MNASVGLDQIRHAFFEDHASATDALHLLESVRAGKSRRNLYSVLRHHDEREISDGETWTRDDFDFLIAYFAMVEVGRLSGFIRGRLPVAHTRLARMVLAHPAVRIYYEENYPLTLPQAHLLFVDGTGVVPEPAVERDGPRLFERFFALSQPLEMGDSVETILWFLDGGARNGYDIDDVLTLIERRREFIDYLTDRPEDYVDGELSTLAAAVQGLADFLRFVPSFNCLLEASKAYPMLQSAFWHYHGYWFEQLSAYVGINVRLAIDSLVTLQKRVVRRRPSSSDAKSAAHWRAELEQSLTALSSGRYRWPLVEAVGRKRALRL